MFALYKFELRFIKNIFKKQTAYPHHKSYPFSACPINTTNLFLNHIPSSPYYSFPYPYNSPHPKLPLPLIPPFQFPLPLPFRERK